MYELATIKSIGSLKRGHASNSLVRRRGTGRRSRDIKTLKLLKHISLGI
jgi:hypothetical protein